MFLVPLNHLDYDARSEAIRTRLAEELEDRAEMACWVNDVCGCHSLVATPPPVE